jgi:hypothetical protein
VTLEWRLSRILTSYRPAPLFRQAGGLYRVCHIGVKRQLQGGASQFPGISVWGKQQTYRSPFDTLRANGAARESVTIFAVRAEPIAARPLAATDVAKMLLCTPAGRPGNQHRGTCNWKRFKRRERQQRAYDLQRSNLRVVAVGHGSHVAEVHVMGN